MERGSWKVTVEGDITQVTTTRDYHIDRERRIEQERRELMRPPSTVVKGPAR